VEEYIMRIKCSNPATRKMGMNGQVAEFDEEGYATVTKELGEALVAANPDHVEVVSEKATRKPKGA